MSRPLLIYVVEDNAMQATIAQALLEKAGHVVRVKSSSVDALKEIPCERPDCVLIDIMMPQMDGWEVLKLLRVDDETAHIPVAMLSARTEAKDRVQGLQEGAIDYICKPFALQELLGKIETIFSQIGERGQATR